jgi:hypothetical protein
MTLPLPGSVYRLTVDQYDRMVEDRTLSADDPVELLGGVPVRKMLPDPDQAAGRYWSRVDFGPGDQVPVVLDGCELCRIPVADLLPTAS